VTDLESGAIISAKCDLATPPIAPKPVSGAGGDWDAERWRRLFLTFAAS
jgi:hypothetical protein